MKAQLLTPTALPALATEVIESLYQHRLLSTPQIRELHSPGTHPSFVRRLLAALTENELVSYAPGGGRLKLWYLTRAGTEAVETLGTLAEPRRKQITPEQAAGPLRMHTLAVNDVGIAFVKAARDRNDDCGPLSWRHEIAHPIAPRRGRQSREMLIADALLSYTEQRPDGGLIEHQCFIELDRATIPVRALVEKFQGYISLRDYDPARYGDRRELGWRDYYREFPGVLVILAHRDRALLRRRIQSVIALYQADDRTHGCRILIGVLEELSRAGPNSPMFIDPENPDQYVDWRRQPQPERHQ